MGYAVQPFGLARALCGIAVFFAISFMTLCLQTWLLLTAVASALTLPLLVFTAVFSHGAGGA